MNLCWCLFVITPNESLEICFTVPKTCFQTIKDKLNVSALLQCWLVPVLLLNKHSLNHSQDTGARRASSAQRRSPWVGLRNTAAPSSQSGNFMVCGCLFGLAALFSVAVVSRKGTTWHSDEPEDRTVMLPVCLYHVWLRPNDENTYSGMTTLSHTILTWNKQETLQNKPIKSFAEQENTDLTLQLL